MSHGFQLALVQMRHSARNLLAVCLATMLGVAFVAATLATGNVLEGTFANALSWQYKGADVIVTTDDAGGIDPHLVDRIRGIDGVASAENRYLGVGIIQSGSREVYPLLANVPQAPAMRSDLTLEVGRLPETSGEVAVVSNVADELDAKVGDSVQFQSFGGGATVSQTIVGILTAPSSLAGRSPDVFGVLDEAAIAQTGLSVDSILVVATSGTSDTDLTHRLNGVLGDGTTARTFSQQADRMAKDVSGDVNFLSIGLLAFAVIALFVAGIVIGNTFTVLVTQRTRNLALLRCVGATRAQVRRSVLIEALGIGIVASIAGIVLGIGGLGLVLRLYAGATGNITLSTGLDLSPSDLIVPFALGFGATMVAAWGPARGATRVAPLAALRPQSMTDFRATGTRWRTAIAGLLLAGGGALLLGGVVVAFASPGFLPIGIGVMGGIVSFVGVMVGGVLIVPRGVGWLGALFTPMGAPAAIAAANSVRNPKRTTATAMALLVAVTLVTMMSVGAESSKSTLNDVIDAYDPVDLVVRAETSDAALPADAIRIASEHPDVERAMPVTAASLPINGATETVLGVDADLARQISASSALDGLGDGVVIVPKGTAADLGIADGATIVLTGPSGDISLQAKVTDLAGEDLVMTRSDLAAVAPDAPVQRVWLQFRGGVNGGDATGHIQDALAGHGQFWYEGGARDKAQNARVLDTMLLIVTLLLGVAVVIALVGVGNTLSLSVIERTRESAVLRALGLTRWQMRRMLALEGMLIASVGVALGIVLGGAYGAIGTLTLFGDEFGISLVVPWDRVAVIVVIGLLAGVLASVLPARAALKVSPVSALAE
ncbi:MAG: FtsX-like permease family protein [Thermomicrobiales bacterium]